MSKGMFVLLTCLLACSTITAQFDAIDDEEFTAAVAENGASVVSVTGEDASASQPLIADFPASVEPEPSFAGSAELPSAEETTESFVPSVATESEILPEDFEGETVQDSLEDEEALIDEDGASNAKVLTIVGSCIAALGALVVF